MWKRISYLKESGLTELPISERSDTCFECDDLGKYRVSLTTSSSHEHHPDCPFYAPEGSPQAAEKEQQASNHASELAENDYYVPDYMDPE